MEINLTSKAADKTNDSMGDDRDEESVDQVSFKIEILGLSMIMNRMKLHYLFIQYGQYLALLLVMYLLERPLNFS
jgi:hypothetical protein